MKVALFYHIAVGPLGEYNENSAAETARQICGSYSDDGEPGIGIDFGRISTGGAITITTISIIAVTFAMLTSV